MKDLIEFARETISEHPHLKSKIEGLIELCQSEIEQGESAEHEIDLCKEDIRQLIEDNDDELDV